MSKPFSVKPSQKAVKAYYEALAKYAQQHVEHETALRSAFQNLLDQTGRRFGWTLIPELSENIIFEDTRTAYLHQNGGQAMKADLADRRQLRDLLNAFLAHVEPAHDDFGKAIDEFKERVPELARGLVREIDEAHQANGKFQKGFEGFFG